jgi:DNA mismatch repair protein MutH
VTHPRTRPYTLVRSSRALAQHPSARRAPAIVLSRIRAPLARDSCAWLVLARGQQGAAWMAGGMLALDVVAGRGQTRRVRVGMCLATVHAAQAAHHTRGAFPHGGVALRAVPGQERGQPVGVHTSSFWATVRWAL